MIKEIFKWVIILWIALLFSSMLSGCSLFSSKPTVIQTNNFHQTNYYTDECYAGKKTFSEIILCLESKSKMEISQNNTTNELLESED